LNNHVNEEAEDDAFTPKEEERWKKLKRILVWLVRVAKTTKKVTANYLKSKRKSIQKKVKGGKVDLLLSHTIVHRPLWLLII
jgi:hypothetical protein